MSDVIKRQLEIELNLPVSQVDVLRVLQLLDELLSDASDKEALTWGGVFLPQIAAAYAAKALLILEQLIAPESQQDDPPFQMEWLHPFMRRYQQLDISPFLGSPPNDYPEERQRITITELSPAEAEQYIREPVEISHTEDVATWSATIRSTLNGTMRFSELQEKTNLAHAELTLGVLLGGFFVEQEGLFYEKDGVIVAPA